MSIDLGLVPLTPQTGHCAATISEIYFGICSNPPGRRKVSDMISLVAEPLLESAPDYDSKAMILNLAALTWNFTLLGRSL